MALRWLMVAAGFLPARLHGGLRSSAVGVGAVVKRFVIADVPGSWIAEVDLWPRRWSSLCRLATLLPTAVNSEIIQLSETSRTRRYNVRVVLTGPGRSQQRLQPATGT